MERLVEKGIARQYIFQERRYVGDGQEKSK